MEALDLHKTSIGLDELAKHLSGFETENRYSYDDWLKRLLFFWELNPHYDSSQPRGWTLCEKDRIRGFIGAIQAQYQAMKNGPRSRRRPLSATQHHPTPSLIDISWHCNEP